MGKRTQSFDPRQVMRRANMEAFHSYDRQQRIVDLHHHDFYEIYYFISGDVEYRVEGKSYTLQTGDLLLISPGVFHQPVVQPGTPYERIVLWLDREYLATLDRYGAAFVSCFDPTGAVLLHPDPQDRVEIFSALGTLCEEFATDRADAPLYRHGLCLQILCCISRLTAESAPKQVSQTPELVELVLAYIAAHFREKLTLQQLADHFYVSKYHLSHTFSAKVGTSIYRYILLKRLLAARELLATGHTPSEACRSCGFQDYANFYRAFQAEYGISPSGFSSKN